MFSIVSPAVGDKLYDDTHDEGQALLLAVRHALDNGTDADVRFDGEPRWYVGVAENGVVQVEWA